MNNPEVYRRFISGLASAMSVLASAMSGLASTRHTQCEARAPSFP
jgi:hypothetical protein